MPLRTRVKKSGFTLIELLVAIAISAALFAAYAVPSYINYMNKVSVEGDTDKLSVVLRDASERSRTQQDDSQWGVHFTDNPGVGNDYYEVWMGESYTLGTVTQTTYLNGRVGFTEDFVFTDIVFEKSTGLPDTSYELELQSANGKYIGTILVDLSGRITSSITDLGEEETPSPPPPSPGITITESGGSTNVREGGTTDTYTVVLDTAPSANVVVTITNSNGEVTPSPTPITFTTTNWSTPRTITVTAVDDSDVEGSHTGTITHSASSSDSNYDGISIDSVTVNITDNDEEPLPSQLPTLVQAKTYASSGTQSPTITLDAAPTTGNELVVIIIYRSDVTITNPPGWTTVVDDQVAWPLDTRILRKTVSGEGTTITWTNAMSGNGFYGWAVFEVADFSSVDVYATDDSEPNAVTFQSTGTTGSTGLDDELVLGAVAVYNAGASTALDSWTNSFSAEDDYRYSSTFHIFAASKTTSATGVQETTASWTGGSGEARGGIVVIKGE